MQGDWVAATASVLAAIVGVVGGYIIARYQREQRELRFVIMEPQDLSATLRNHGDFQLKFREYTTTELMLSTVTVRNTGNQALKDITFLLKLVGEHPFAQISCSSDNRALPSEVNLTTLPSTEPSPEFMGALPFFNPGERFELKVLYDGNPSSCEVVCRLPDTTVNVFTAAELMQRNSRRDRWKTLMTLLLAGALAFGLGWFGKNIIAPASPSAPDAISPTLRP